MKLIDAPIGIFRFDGELVLKTEYKSENKLSGKYIPDCYIVRTGEYFWGGAKTANELNNLDVEPVDFAELLPTVTDTISRQAAIKACGGYLVPANIIRELPPAQPEPSQVAKDIARIVENEQDMMVIAQPERIKGHWIDGESQCGIKCSKCGYSVDDFCHSIDYIDLDYAPNYCPHCGADMREE